MTQYLYRGVSENKHTETEGKLIPKGNNIKTVMYRGDFNPELGFVSNRSHPDGRFTRDYSETNTVRAHHIESGMHDGSFISTTTSIELARKFATNEWKEPGYIYVIDPELFEEYEVTALKDPDPQYPNEYEVSIRAVDGGEIPKEVITRIVKA